MSQENVEIVRAFFAAALDDPKSSGHAYLAEDVVFIPLGRLTGSSEGPRGFVGCITDIADQFDEYEVRPERLQGAGDLVVADLRRETRSKRSPALITDRFAQIFTVREGKITRIRSVPSFVEALEA